MFPLNTAFIGFSAQGHVVGGIGDSCSVCRRGGNECVRGYCDV